MQNTACFDLAAGAHAGVRAMSMRPFNTTEQPNPMSREVMYITHKSENQCCHLIN